MMCAAEQHERAWLHEQVSMMRRWHDALLSGGAGGTPKADAIASHLSWLEARLQDLTLHAAA